ncbi:hypothetical protein BU16DRAFT_555313 [Lophium mytilinum]|uniref:MYND-type domain-containing protein n=1 Tax=Lophium mytilinum TaxID=390894 RepID=A0A6A6RER1_9PEZI|nr:hypothetical protein BU16DRAFT_555313 [Lophium mytilinum]
MAEPPDPTPSDGTGSPFATMAKPEDPSSITTTTASPTREPQNCGHCRKEATLRCGRCASVVYCNADCQKANWMTHKKTCGTGKILQHAAEIYKMAWLAYREQTLDIDIVKVEERGNQLLLHLRHAGWKHSIGGFFFKFPTTQIHSDEDKEALLTSMMCEDALAHLHEFFARMVQGSYENIEEVAVRLKPPRRTTAHCLPDGKIDRQTYQHLLLRVTSRDGFKIAIDPTGAQNAQMKAWLPWREYENLYVERVLNILPFGTYRDISINEAAKGKGAPGFIARINWEAITKAFNEGIKTWETASQLTPSRLVRKWDESSYSEVVKMQLSITQALKAHIATKNYEKGFQAALDWDVANQGYHVFKARQKDILDKASLLPKPQPLEVQHTVHDSGVHKLKFPGFTLLDMSGGATEMLSGHMRPGMTSKEVLDLLMRNGGLGVTK